MKKLSLAMAAAMCLTVGGVYATWNYAEGNAPSTNGKLPITLSSIVAGSTKGTIDMVEDNIAFTIDQDKSTDEIKVQHKAMLTSTGTLTVSFTPKSPDDGVDEDVYNNGIVLKMIIKENLGDWDGVDILQYVDTDGEGSLVTIDETNGCIVVTLNDGNPVKGTIGSIDISQYLAIGEFYLETPEEYYAFSDYIATITDRIHLYVADAETPIDTVLATQTDNR